MACESITGIVYTVRGLCRTCYTCVRECPAKAIKINNGQAEVIQERCIACGTCTKVCSQDAKRYIKSVDKALALLQSPTKAIAILDPSFPAEFEKLDHKKVVGMLRKLGFYKVTEVAFAADVIAGKYKQLFENKDKPYISANCPAVVHFICQFHPNLVHLIAPLVSPMVAMSRIVKKKYGDDVSVIFIGPCVSKKFNKEIDAVLTFDELRELFEMKEIKQQMVKATEFDPPFGRKGMISTLRGGMIQAMELEENLLEGRVVVAEGRVDFPDAVKEFDAGFLESLHLDLLCCKGCIMGAGMSVRGRQYRKRRSITDYAQKRINQIDIKQWQADIDEFSTIDFNCNYQANDRRYTLPLNAEIKKILETMNKYSARDHLNCGACGYDTCIEQAIAITRGLAEIEMCLPYTIEKLHKSVNELAVSNQKLATMREALKQSEKLASMGQLSAGIAHELNNPLGVVVMYSNLLHEETEDPQVKKDLELIVEQADRCKKIVGDLLNFARKSNVRFEEIDIKQLVDNSLSSLIIPDWVNLVRVNKYKFPLATLDIEQMTQVLNNLVKNAIEAMPKSGTLTIIVSDTTDEVVFEVTDTGTGISKEDLHKIFEPFFTTKEIGKGTGLGLATSYGIVKMHKGQISVVSNNDPVKGQTGTTFKVVIPRNTTDFS